jgi:hypothetical protein
MAADGVAGMEMNLDIAGRLAKKGAWRGSAPRGGCAPS